MPGLHHVGYWVDDLDSALTRWGQDLGVGPFQVIEHVAFEEFVLTVGGRRHDDVVFDHSAAFAAWGPVVVELGQVHAIDDRLAAAYGVAPAAYGAASGAVSHVSWVVPDLTRESARLARLGCRLINTARSGPISVAWHDGGALFPHPAVRDVLHRTLAQFRDPQTGVLTLRNTFRWVAARRADFPGAHI